MAIRIPEKLEFLQLPRQTGRSTMGQIWFDQNAQTFKVREDNGNSSYLQSKGNQSLLSTLNDPTAILDAYVSSTGFDDLDGYGYLPTRPFLTIQKALDEIPEGAQGHVRINLRGVGPFENFAGRYLKSPTQLFIYIIGDTSSPVETWTNIGLATAPTNSAGGTKKASVSYNVGSYGTTFGDGTHWAILGTVGGEDFSLYINGAATVIDGATSVSPNIRTPLKGYESLPAKAYAFTSIVDNSGWGNYGVSERRAEGNVATITVMGCILSPSFGEPGANVSYLGCKFPEGYNDITSNSALLFGNWYDSSINLCASISLGAGSVSLSGIFKKGVQFAPAFGYLSGVFRGLDNDSIAVKLGSHIGVAGTVTAGVEFDNSDFELFNGVCIQMNNANSRFGNDEGFSCDGYQTRFLTVRSNCSISINRVYGTTTAAPFDIQYASNIYSLSVLTSSSPNLHNSSASTQNVIVGSAGTFNYTDLPQTDLVRLVRVE